MHGACSRCHAFPGSYSSGKADNDRDVFEFVDGNQALVALFDVFESAADDGKRPRLDPCKVEVDGEASRACQASISCDEVSVLTRDEVDCGRCPFVDFGCRNNSPQEANVITKVLVDECFGFASPDVSGDFAIEKLEACSCLHAVKGVWTRLQQGLEVFGVKEPLMVTV